MWSISLAVIHFEINNAMGADIHLDGMRGICINIFNYSKRQTINWVQFTVGQYMMCSVNTFTATLNISCSTVLLQTALHPIQQLLTYSKTGLKYLHKTMGKHF